MRSGGAALTVVEGAGPNRLARAGAVPRVRPGDRPLAIDLELTSKETTLMRAAARDAGLGVDAYVSVLVEYTSLCELVGRERVQRIADAARTTGCVDVVAPPELQTWHRLIAGPVAPSEDDLPTVFVPLRLATALSPSARAQAVKQTVTAAAGEIGRAAALEAAATAHGVVMQTWVLAQIAGCSGSPATAL